MYSIPSAAILAVCLKNTIPKYIICIDENRQDSGWTDENFALLQFRQYGPVHPNMENIGLE